MHGVPPLAGRDTEVYWPYVVCSRWSSRERSTAMATSERYVVVGVFRDPAEARSAIEALRDAQFGGEDVSVLMPDRSGASKVEAQLDKAGEGAATGAVLG